MSSNIRNIFKFSKKDKANKLMLAKFDHEWFKEEYEIDGCDDCSELYQIYKNMLKTEPVSPNKDFNESYYLNRYPDVRKAVKESSFSCGFEHYVLMGQKEGRIGSGENHVRANYESDDKQIKLLFDEQWYLRTYPLAANEIAETGTNAFEYYNTRGIEQKHSPNSWFDEVWYLAFYADVIEEIEYGNVRSGFEHYLKYGRAASRIPRRKVKDILEYKFPGLTRLTAIESASQLENKLQPMPVEMVSSSAIRINFVLPTIDRDIMFGGYAAILQLIKKVVSMGFDTRILVTEDAHITKEYAHLNIESILGDVHEKEVEFENITNRSKRIKISPNDRFVAYSAWTSMIASNLAECTSENKFIFLIQEDERIFHHNDSMRALVESAYSLPHVALFNSSELQTHFMRNKLGVYENELSPGQSVFSFEHVLTQVSIPNEGEIAHKTGKRLLFYARPESHAARNIFELGFLGLKEAIRHGYFDRTWSFDGVGTLVEKRNVDIGRGNVLNMMPKLDGGSYGSLLANYDVGMSLMYAPHPGLVHFEMASAGMVVVTNEYERRNVEYFQNKSANFVVAKPTIQSIANALKIAAQKASDIPARMKNIYKPQSANSWDQVFTDELLVQLLSSLGIKNA